MGSSLGSDEPKRYEQTYVNKKDSFNFDSFTLKRIVRAFKHAYPCVSLLNIGFYGYSIK